MSATPNAIAPGMAPNLESHPAVDLPAVSRVSRCVDLKSVRLSELTVSGSPRKGSDLVPIWKHTCELTERSPSSLEVTFRFDFAGRSGEEVVATALIKYVLCYELTAAQAFTDADLPHFVFANGTYHAWPFVRQLLFDLTAHLGFPPFTLPVFLFNPKPPAPKTQPAAATPEPPPELAAEKPAD